MKIKVFITVLLLFPSVIFSKESKLYEHYIGYTHLGFSLLLDKIKSTFVYSTETMCFSGVYKESQKADTLFLQTTHSTISDDTNRNIIFIKKGNKIVDVTDLYYKEIENIGLPIYCPKEMNKVKVPILKDEKELLNFRPWILR